MERILAQVIESILSKVADSFCSKVVDHTTDNAHSSLKGMSDFELTLKTLKRKLKSLSAKASDVEEEIKNAELSGRKKRKREVEEWLEEVRSIEDEVVELGSQLELEGFITRLMEGGKVAMLNLEVEELVEQSRNFGELVLEICGTKGETFLTDGMVGKAFHDNVGGILELLEMRRASIIGIYGMGGVGKTTLAMHINNRLLQQSQPPVFWVTVSQEFTISSLQEKIARLLGLDLSDEDNEGRRAARLHAALSKRKNPVLILDDVWENINILKVGCPVSKDCCRLIITTRSLKVCRQIQCQEEIQVKKLNEDESWKLFSETLGNGIVLDSRVEEIAKSVAKMCDGLPLGIITVAGSMRGEKSIHTWTNALGELKERVVGQDAMGEDDEVSKVLKYSFDRLNRNQRKQSNEFNMLQLCFLHCSLYPEDCRILKDNLVRKFISEGLVDQRKSRRAQIHQGYSIIDKLVNVCLLESGISYEEYVKMHDLVRGMALMIGEGKFMVKSGDYSLIEIPHEQEWTPSLEKVSLMMSGIKEIGDGISPDCPNLSTLILCGSLLHVIPNSFFSKMQNLCSLDLCETDITTLPDSICDMKSLKVLFLEYCYKLEKVPYLGKLEALKELNLSATAIKEVPQGLEELLNLRFLSLDAEGLETLPRGLLPKLKHLQHVNVPLHVQVPIEEIMSLKWLEEFSGRVRTVDDFNCFISTRVRDTCYKIGVGMLGSPRHKYFELYNNELILCELNLKDEKVLGQDTLYLTIWKCEGLSICFVDDFPGLNNPQSLKRVRIVSCGGIECISNNEQGSLPSKISIIEEIVLVELDGLKEVMKKDEVGAASAAPAAQAVFSSLRRLVISKCKKVGKLGLPVMGVPNLEIIEIKVCGEMEEIFEDEGRGSVTLPKLRELHLQELPRLNSFCKAKVISNSMATIEIVQCPRLIKKLPVNMDVPPPPTLRVIRVGGEWWESLEWDNPSIPQLLLPFLQLF